MCGFLNDNKSAKFHINILSMSENIAKFFVGGYFLIHTVAMDPEHNVLLLSVEFAEWNFCRHLAVLAHQILRSVSKVRM